MTERYRNSQYDPRISPQYLLLSILKARMSPHDNAVRVIWGKRPTLLLGGVAEIANHEGQVSDRSVSITTEPWLTPDPTANSRQIMYDIHFLSANAANRRFAVCAGATFTAQSMGRLTAEKLIREVDTDIIRSLAHLAKIVRPSEQATAQMHTQLSEWGVVEPVSQIDTMYPDMGAYHYTEVLKEEWIESDE